MWWKIKNYFVLKKRIGEKFYILPAGLYDETNKLLGSTKIMKNILTKRGFKIGDRVVLKKFNFKNYWKNWLRIFEKIIEKRLKKLEIKVTNPKELTIPDMLEEIKKFGYSKKKTPYENYLEACVLNFFIQSLNNSKSLVGGIWGSGGVRIGYDEYPRKETFAHFVENIHSKNLIIQKLREILYQYPEELRTTTEGIKLPVFSETHTEYESILEYRILQIKFKIILQEICLHSYYMTPEDKKFFDDYFNEVKMHIKTYPVNNKK